MDYLSEALAERLIDLGYDPNEPRDHATGRWTEGGANAGLAAMSQAADLGKGLGRATRAKQDPHAYLEQSRAQLAASSDYNSLAEVNLMDDPDSLLNLAPGPERAWAVYQMNGGYQMMNRQLRFGDGVCYLPITGKDGRPAKAEDEVKDMLKAFDVMGYTTKNDATFWRVVSAYPGDDDKPPGERGGLDPETMQVGDTFTDKGIISTSSNPDEVAGFMDEYQGDEAQTALFQIKVPAGTRVLGGSTGGIETMLHPGSKFKITGKSKKIIGGVGNPGYAGYIGKHTLTTIEMELQP